MLSKLPLNEENMKKIKFQNLNSKNNILWISVMVLGVIFMFMETFDLYTFENPKISKFIYFLLFLSLSIYHSRLFWFKNVVQWNKKGLTARINNFWGVNTIFENIQTIIFRENEFVISEFNGNRKTINLKNIDLESKKKLEQILKTNVDIIKT